MRRRFTVECLAPLRPGRFFMDAIRPLNDRRLLAVLALCFVSRFAVLALYPNGFWSVIGAPVGVDGWTSYAERIVGIGDYPPGMNRPPVFPLFLAGIYAVFGVDYFAARVALIFLDVGSCLAVYFLANRLFGNRAVSLGASAAWALYFPEFPYVTHIWSEPFFTLILLLFAFSMVKAYSTPRAYLFVIMGMLYGLLNLTRTELNAFFVVMLFLYSVRFRPLRFLHLRLFLVFLLTALIVVSPWGLRNYFRFGRFRIASPMVGLQLYCAGHKFERDEFVSIRSFDCEGILQDIRTEPNKQGRRPDFDRLNDAEKNDVYMREGVKLIFRHPVRYSIYWLNNLLNFCLGISDFSFFSWRSVGICAVNTFLILWAMIGFIRYGGPWIDASRPIIALVLYSTAAHAAVMGTGRYALPIIPYVGLFASYGLVNSARAGKAGGKFDSSVDR